MYKIIGGDGKEYGPISEDVLRQWIAQSRANGQTQVLREGHTEWKPLSELPEFSTTVPVTPPTLPSGPAASAAVLDQVNAPAIGLMIAAGLGFLVQATMLLSRLAGNSTLAAQQGAPSWVIAFSGRAGIVASMIGLLMSFFIFIGGLKMRSLTNYGFVVAASILAMVPCVSPCCLLGLPIGIWALVVLSKPEVKNAFQ